MEARPRRRVALRLAALALAGTGAVVLLGTRPLAGSAAGTAPPPSTVATAIAVDAGKATPGTIVRVTGSGFVPTLAYTLQFCPAPRCFPNTPPATCGVPAADAQGNMACSFEVARDAMPGDWVVTVHQDVTGAAAGTACPVATPVATVPPLPTSLPSAVPSLPIAAPSLSPGATVIPCVREASAIVTVVPPPDDLSGLLPPDVTPTLEPSIAVLPPLPEITPAPIAPAPPQPPVVQRTPRPALRLRPVGFPLRDLIPGLILVAASAVVFLGSLVPAPARPAPAPAASGSRLRRFVAAMGPRGGVAGPAVVPPVAPPPAARGAASRLGSFATGQAGVGARIVRALRSMRG